MNFALILFVLLLVSGAIWALDSLLLKPRRQPDAKDPWWVEYGAGFFPVILIVFVLRSFIVEPFKIPSGSMIPTLLVGDFILVNKYTYGIRLPIINKKGLHARATAKFVQCVENFDCDVYVSRCGETVGGTSIMGILTLGAGIGTTIKVAATGAQAEQAIEAITTLVANRFGEDE